MSLGSSSTTSSSSSSSSSEDIYIASYLYNEMLETESKGETQVSHKTLKRKKQKDTSDESYEVRKKRKLESSSSSENDNDFIYYPSDSNDHPIETIDLTSIDDDDFQWTVTNEDSSDANTTARTKLELLKLAKKKKTKWMELYPIKDNYGYYVKRYQTMVANSTIVNPVFGCQAYMYRYTVGRSYKPTSIKLMNGNKRCSMNGSALVGVIKYRIAAPKGYGEISNYNIGGRKKACTL
jgi:hypothetical protein